MASVTSRRSTFPVAVTSGRTEVAPVGAEGPNHKRPDFETDATIVLRELREAFGALLASSPAPTASCTEVEAALGIDAMLAWQVLKIARADEPLAAGIKVPARVSMQKLLKSAGRRRVPDAVTDRVSRAFDEYERLVADHAGSRSDFEMMVSAYLPGAREKAELAGKQAAFKGMSQVKGVMAEADFTAAFFIPNPDGVTIDNAMIEGHLGIRRIWPGSQILFSDAVFGASSQLRTLAGDPISSGQETLVPNFSTSPLPKFKHHAAGTISYNSVLSQDIGLRSAVDLVRAMYRTSSHSRYRRPGKNATSGMIEVLEFPAKRLTLDVFVHESLYPNTTPELGVYDTSSDGIAMYNDPAREHDRMHTHEVIRPIGNGFTQAKLTHIPRYVEMLQYVSDTCRLNPREYRGYRLDVQYPVHAAQYTIAFRKADPPEESSATR